MRQSREEAIDGVTSGLISLDEEVTWRARHFGVPLQMTSRITEMQKPTYFVDEQVRGPFQRFRHVHEFSQDSAGTTMVDRVEFAAPFGPNRVFGRETCAGPLPPKVDRSPQSTHCR